LLVAAVKELGPSIEKVRNNSPDKIPRLTSDVGCDFPAAAPKALKEFEAMESVSK